MTTDRDSKLEKKTRQTRVKDALRRARQCALAYYKNLLYCIFYTPTQENTHLDVDSDQQQCKPSYSKETDGQDAHENNEILP